MNTVTTRWVLWVSLVLLLPLPFFSQQVMLLPAGYWIKVLVHTFTGGNGEAMTIAVNLAMQLLLAVLATGLLAHLYTVWSKHWPSKIRGSIMGLSIFTLLIIFSSIPVYDSIKDDNKQTFLQVYQ